MRLSLRVSLSFKVVSIAPSPSILSLLFLFLAELKDNIGPLLFMVYINDLSTALGDPAFLFADEMKMVFPRSQSSHIISYLSPAWAWAVELDLSIKPNCWEPPTPFLRHFPRQTLIIKCPPSLTSEVWGFLLKRHSPRQCAAVRLPIQPDGCYSWSSKKTLSSINFTHVVGQSNLPYLPAFVAVRNGQIVGRTYEAKEEKMQENLWKT